MDDNIIENLKFVFMEKGLLFNDINIEDNKSEECEEIDDSGVDNNLNREINKINPSFNFNGSTPPPTIF